MPYAPIEDHAVIGNLHTAAIVSLRGSIDFLCFPRFDSPTIFARLLDDGKGGSFSFEFPDEEVRYKQLYLPDTNILITRFLGTKGIAELTDFMPIAQREDDFAIYRRLKGVHGKHRVTVSIQPRFDYARAGCRVERHPEGRGYFLYDDSGTQPGLWLKTEAELEPVENGLTGTFHLDQGQNIDFLLTTVEAQHPGTTFMSAFITILVEYVIAHWREADHGIWEVRSGKQRFLHSAVCCWVALDRAMKIAEDRSLPYPRAEWRAVRDEMYYEIFDDFWNEKLGAYPQFLGSDTVDASALLMPLLRFVSSKEPRWLKTLEKIEEKLSADVLIFRYKQEHGAEDGLEGEESSFTICSFWYAECLARTGRVKEATVVMQKLLGYANHLGLFSEEIGMHGEQLGNFPQAFSHLSLISAAFQIDRRLKKGAEPER